MGFNYFSQTCPDLMKPFRHGHIRVRTDHPVSNPDQPVAIKPNNPPACYPKPRINATYPHVQPF
jgi:hypothetical protein